LSATDLQDVLVLLVEDQMIVAMQIEDMLRAGGCEVVGPVGTLQEALALVHEKELDLAVLDITIDGEPIYPVAEALQARGIPFVFATGYGESTLPEKWRNRPRLGKPFRHEQLERILTNITGRSHARA
jgi:CheY-like chemotaxis protein